MEKVGFYIGSFDPPHYGHKSVVEQMLKRGLCDKVIVYPAWGDDPLKKRAPVEVRIEMLKALFEGLENVELPTCDPQEMQQIYTEIDPATAQHSNWKERRVVPKDKETRFVGIVGTDVANDLHQEYQSGVQTGNWDKKRITVFMRGVVIPDDRIHIGTLMALPVTEFIVAKRIGETAPDRIGERPVIGTVEDEQSTHLSSTELKKQLYANRSVADFVSPQVEAIIRKNNLYIA